MRRAAPRAAHSLFDREIVMSKRASRKKARRKKKANKGKRPNAS
jgi:hypothetical protein